MGRFPLPRDYEVVPLAVQLPSLDILYLIGCELQLTDAIEFSMIDGGLRDKMYRILFRFVQFGSTACGGNPKSSLHQFMTTIGTHRFVEGIRFGPSLEGGLENWEWIHFNKARIEKVCRKFLQLVAQQQTPSFTKLTMVHLSNLALEDQELNWLSAVSSVRFVTLENTEVVETAWREAVHDPLVSTVTELKFLHPSITTVSQDHILFYQLGASLQIIRVEEPSGWDKHRTKWNSCPGVKLVMIACGLSLDPSNICPNLKIVEFSATTSAGRWDRWTFMLQPLDPTKCVPRERLWTRVVREGSTKKGQTYIDKCKDLNWQRIFSP